MAQALMEQVIERIGQVVLGKQHQVRMAVACLLARGHLLLEDLPGMGKTTLSQQLAHTLGLSWRRIQFTADLLPGDILGTSVFERDSSQFVFHPGPIFTQLLLADEINRATPKSQSALLEAMEERQVTSEGVTRALPEPFFVIATQNPASQGGTFELPESQLDRFLMRLSLGYPGESAERQMLAGAGRTAAGTAAPALMQPGQLQAIQQQVQQVRCSDAVLDYLLRLVMATRNHPQLAYGLSPRGSLALQAAARSWAYLAGRDYVIPEDIQTVAMAVMPHRLEQALTGTRTQGAVGLSRQLLDEVRVL